MRANRPKPIRVTHEAQAALPLLQDMLTASGSASHAHAARMAHAGDSPLTHETMAVFLHQLSILHGRKPSLFEVVMQSPATLAAGWLNRAARAFAAERDLLARLVVAAGPPRPRAGQTTLEATIDATRGALLTLGHSDRRGCAIGAAAALLLDWETIAACLRRIAIRLDVKPAERHPEWPAPAETWAVLEELTGLPGGERAVTFGFQTLLAQHRAFWDIVQG